MFTHLKNHPFNVEAFFESSAVLTFAVPQAELAPLIPESLELDVFEDTWAFLAVAMVETRNLRPKGFPEFLGRDFFLIGYRIFVRYTTSEGKRLRGLYIIRSETDSKTMEFFGNLFTHYRYTETDIRIEKVNGKKTIISGKSDFALEITEDSEIVSLPAGSPFLSWKQARRFAGPLPFTFTYDREKQEMLIIEGVRSNWTPKPLQVDSYRSAFIDGLGLNGLVLANAFVVNQIPYWWKKGRTDPSPSPRSTRLPTTRPAPAHDRSERARRSEPWRSKMGQRRPFQGVVNILSFNRHFYIAGIAFLALCFSSRLFIDWPDLVFWLIVAAVLYGLVMPLFISAWVYDFSGYYRMDWIQKLTEKHPGIRSIVNIHAGFDEMSHSISALFPQAQMHVFDFYNAKRHTEPAIIRARKVTMGFPGTQSIASDHIPIQDHSADLVMLLSAVHEIRSHDEKVRFLRECRRICKPGGQVIMSEHLRDFPNFLAFTIGFTHFFSRKTWKDAFQRAGFSIIIETKFTPFMSVFRSQP